jgi:hypothetical protein
MRSKTIKNPAICSFDNGEEIITELTRENWLKERKIEEQLGRNAEPAELWRDGGYWESSGGCGHGYCISESHFRGANGKTGRCFQVKEGNFPTVYRIIEQV